MRSTHAALWVLLLATAAAPASDLRAAAAPVSADSVAGLPAPALQLTVEQAVARALANGEEVKLSRALTREADGRVREAFSAALPQVTGAFAYTRQIESLYAGAGADSTLAEVFSNSPFGAANRWSLEITASQRLFSGGKVGSGIRAARAVRQSARAQEREAAVDLAWQVKRAYFDAALAGRLVDIAEGALRQSRAHLHDVQLAHREGNRAEYDLLRAQVDAANQEPAAVAARNDFTLALLELKRLANVPLDQPVALATPLDFEQDGVPAPANDELSVADRPALRAAEADLLARTHLLQLERGYRWPDLMLTSTWSQQAFPGEVLPQREQFRRNWDASLKLEFPIFLGLRTEGQIQRARAELERAEARLEQLREASRIELAQARAELERAAALLRARRETVRQANRAHQIANVRYGNGMSPQIEVSDARLQLRTAEVNEAQAVRDYAVALAGLERAVGHPLPLVRRPLDRMTWSPGSASQDRGADLEGAALSEPQHEGVKP